MQENFIYAKNYFSNKSLSLEDPKWSIYQDPNKSIFQNKIPINNKSQMIFNNVTDKNIENIKLSIYSKMSRNSSNLLLALEKIKYLTKENNSLKKIINNKDKIISDFEVLFRQFKDKFIKIDNINQTLRNKLLDKNPNNVNKELNLDYNKKDLVDSFNIIKGDLNKIESDYNQRLKEKDEILEKMKEELIYIHNEYKNLSEILEKVSNYIMKTNYSELKNKVNDLMEEKELLLKRNVQREERIIDLQKKNELLLFNEDENNKYNTDDLVFTFKNQENEYVKTINIIKY
jgi:hypothetical protein